MCSCYNHPVAMRHMHPQRSAPTHPTSWGHVAGWYDELLEGSGKAAHSYQRTLILPNLLRLLEIRRGQSVLDLACGQGFFARAFAAAGARVVAVGIAPELIVLAEERPHPGIVFRVAPAHALAFIAAGNIQIATLILAVENIEDVAAVFKECRRVLAPSGKLFVVMTHPSFRVPKGSSWQWDPSTHTQYRRIDRYASESRVPIQMHPGDDPAVTTTTFHRPLQWYTKALIGQGFAVTRLEEWVSNRKSQRGPRAAAEDRARKEIPLFLLLEASVFPALI